SRKPLGLPRGMTAVTTRNFADFVKALLEHLNREKIDYAITGAVAVSYYGIPRTTLDADFVIHISPRRTRRFFRGLGDVGMDVDMEKVGRQLRSGYNVITVTDKLSPYSADMIITREPPKKREGMIQGIRAYFQSPESLILAKLRMIKATIPVERSQKDRDDIKAIIANTRFNKRKILNQARKDSTIEIFREILLSEQTRKRSR